MEQMLINTRAAPVSKSVLELNTIYTRDVYRIKHSNLIGFAAYMIRFGLYTRTERKRICRNGIFKKRVSLTFRLSATNLRRQDSFRVVLKANASLSNETSFYR